MLAGCWRGVFVVQVTEHISTKPLHQRDMVRAGLPKQSCYLDMPLTTASHYPALAVPCKLPYPSTSPHPHATHHLLLCSEEDGTSALCHAQVGVRRRGLATRQYSSRRWVVKAA